MDNDSTPQNTVLRELQASYGDRVIAYRPRLAKALGSINAAIFLQQLMHWTKDTPDAWFWHTAEQIEEETCLTRRMQASARAVLVEAGVLEEERRGLPATLHYRINWMRLTEVLNSHNKMCGKRQTGCDESANHTRRELRDEKTSPDGDVQDGETVHDAPKPDWWFTDEMRTALGLAGRSTAEERGIAHAMRSKGFTLDQMEPFVAWMQADPFRSRNGLNIKALAAWYDRWVTATHLLTPSSEPGEQKPTQRRQRIGCWYLSSWGELIDLRNGTPTHPTKPDDRTDDDWWARVAHALEIRYHNGAG